MCGQHPARYCVGVSLDVGMFGPNRALFQFTSACLGCAPAAFPRLGHCLMLQMRLQPVQLIILTWAQPFGDALTEPTHEDMSALDHALDSSGFFDEWRLWQRSLN